PSPLAFVRSSPAFVRRRRGGAVARYTTPPKKPGSLPRFPAQGAPSPAFVPPAPPQERRPLPLSRGRLHRDVASYTGTTRPWQAAVEQRQATIEQRQATTLPAQGRRRGVRFSSGPCLLSRHTGRATSNPVRAMIDPGREDGRPGRGRSYKG